MKMISPVNFLDNENLNQIISDNLVMVNSGDWHFGSLDPEYQYNVLYNQLVLPCYSIDLDVFVIAGDIFDKKNLASSKTVMFACLLLSKIVEMCKAKNVTLLIIKGTDEHDAGQLKLFYSYLQDPDLDIRIVESISFLYIKGCRFLCIPEEYNKSEDYYNEYLLYSGIYDICVMHGMFKGAVYQDQVILPENVNPRNKLFTIEDFINCRGLIISGHVHTPGCFNTYFYYCGCPYRWRFGEEHAKGFIITLYNKRSAQHYNHFQEIISEQYITLNLDDMLDRDPKETIYYVELVLQDIEYLRLEFLKAPTDEQLANINILKNYFRTNNRVKIKTTNSKKQKIVETLNIENERLKEFMFIMDKQLSPYEKFARYINIKEGCEYTSAQEIEELISEEF